MSTRLQISVEGGTSDRTSIELVSGTPVEPFSVGSQASWVVSGAGVMSTHAYLYFDGTTLFVAAAPGVPVRAAGADVGTDWKPLTPPCAIELGAVRLSVRSAGAAATQPHGQPAAPAAAPAAKASEFEDATYDDDAPTQYQPVPPEFLDRARDLETTVRQPNGPEPPLGATLPHPIRVEAPPQSERTRVLPQPGQPEPRPERPERPAPPSVPPTSDGATVVQPLEDFLKQHKPNELDAARKELGAPLPAAGRPPDAGGGYGAPPGAPWSPGAFGAGPPMGAGPMGGPPPMPPGFGGDAQYGGQPGYPPPPGGSFGMPGMPSPGMPSPGMATPAQQYGQVMPGPGQQLPGASGKKDPLEDVKRAWAAASLPRRIMWVLGPFILIGAFYTALKPKPKPRRPTSNKAVASASAAPSASSALGTQQVKRQQPPPDESAQPPPETPTAETADPTETPTDEQAGKTEPEADAAAPEPPPKGQHTKQRQAVDAVALGDYDKAIALYEELAAENPKNRDYKTALEVLKKKQGSGKHK